VDVIVENIEFEPADASPLLSGSVNGPPVPPPPTVIG
jgi:hypothetical protein